MSKPIKQYLALFLDGTHNTEDDSTNILNAYHNTLEGLIETKDNKGKSIQIVQKRYYDRGVGTSVADSVRGGGFGIGLEKNVREAYNWLVDHYNDKDHIYIFGFSRGAYTARSLAGLIAACGLVRRGAPLTLTQLWNGYAFISSNREYNKNYAWWKKTLEKEKNKDYFGRITDLYNRDENEKLINKSEKLIRNWSVRVKINYLGIYDTVGAIGIHALGIPGLRSKLDQHHNQNPSGLFMKCRHALAIDEHRSSFRLTPLLDYVRNKDPKTIEFYKKKIQQRWFAGAHSNIGGGYSNNVLSIAPYNWIMDGAKDAGLQIRPRHEKVIQIDAEIPERSDIRDSFAELAGAIYPHLVRSKRHFRPIGRADLVRAGYTLRPINEEIDASVFELARTDKKYAPINVLAYLRRHPEADNDEAFKGNEVQHFWPGELMNYTDKKSSLKNYILPRVLLIIWSIVAAFGLMKVVHFFWIEPILPQYYVLPIIAGLFVLADWAESKVTLIRHFNPGAVRLEVIWNVLYWIRLLGILTFLIGAIIGVSNSIKWDYKINFSASGIWSYAKLIWFEITQLENIVAFIFAAVLMYILEYAGKKSIVKIKDESIAIDPEKISLEGIEKKANFIFIGATFLLSAAILVFSIYNYWSYIPNVPHSGYLSASLLLIFILIMALPPIFSWVGKPMSKHNANLGSIVQLQTAFNKSDVTALFNAWTNKIHRTWFTVEDEKIIGNLFLKKDVSEESEKNKIVAWVRVREILRRSLWRDIIGFIPLYSILFGAILCIGSTVFCKNVYGIECYTILGKVPLWLCLIIFTAFFDLLENWAHLMHIKNHPLGGSSSFFIKLGGLFTFLKFLGFFTTILLCIAVLVFIGYNVHMGIGDWKWIVASIMTYIFLLKVYPLIVRHTPGTSQT